MKLTCDPRTIFFTRIHNLDDQGNNGCIGLTFTGITITELTSKELQMV